MGDFPRCRTCRRVMNAWGRECIDCVGKVVALQPKTGEEQGRMGAVNKSAPAALARCESGASPNSGGSTDDR